jgi:hypothetical protein
VTDEPATDERERAGPDGQGGTAPDEAPEWDAPDEATEVKATDDAPEGDPTDDAQDGNETEDSPDGDPGGPPVTVAEFLDENYRLFTVISVFAALSVYLSDLGRTGARGVRLGIGAALVLFLIAAVTGVVRAYEATDRVLEHEGLASKLWVLPHALFMYALLFLAVSIFLVIESRYPGEVGDVLASGVMYTLVFVYWALVSADRLYDGLSDRLDVRTSLGGAVRRAPHLSLAPTAVWAALRWDFGPPVVSPDASSTLVVGYVSALVLLHLAFTALVLVVLLGVDAAADEW